MADASDGAPIMVHYDRKAREEDSLYRARGSSSVTLAGLANLLRVPIGRLVVTGLEQAEDAPPAEIASAAESPAPAEPSLSEDSGARLDRIKARYREPSA